MCMWPWELIYNDLANTLRRMKHKNIPPYETLVAEAVETMMVEGVNISQQVKEYSHSPHFSTKHYKSCWYRASQYMTKQANDTSSITYDCGISFLAL